MRVKVGAHWHEATPDQPIMVELTAADRTNIRNMAPDATRYALFHDDDLASIDDKTRWMNVGAEASKV